MCAFYPPANFFRFGPGMTEAALVASGPGMRRGRLLLRKEV